jgi:hypothetical protein
VTSRAERPAERFAPPAAPATKAERSVPAAGERVEARWEELNQRFTVWLPRALVAEAKAAAGERGESIATLVARALRVELRHGTDDGSANEVDGGREDFPGHDPVGYMVILNIG